MVRSVPPSVVGSGSGSLVARYALGRGIGGDAECGPVESEAIGTDRKSTRLNSSHLVISYAVFCLKKKKNQSPALVVDKNSCVNSFIFWNLRFLLCASYQTSIIIGSRRRRAIPPCSRFFF